MSSSTIGKDVNTAFVCAYRHDSGNDIHYGRISVFCDVPLGSEIESGGFKLLRGGQRASAERWKVG